MWGLVLHVQALKASWLILKTTYIVIHKRDGPPYLLSKLVHASQDMCTRKPFLRPTAKLDGKLGSTHMQTFSALGNAAAVSDIPTPCAHVAASIGESRNWGAESHKGNLLSHPTTVHYPSKFYYGLLGLRTYPDFFFHPSLFCLAIKAGFTVRNWLAKIYRPLNKDQRKKLAEATKRLEVTTKKRNAEGKLVVS